MTHTVLSSIAAAAPLSEELANWVIVGVGAWIATSVWRLGNVVARMGAIIEHLDRRLSRVEAERKKDCK